MMTTKDDDMMTIKDDDMMTNKDDDFHQVQDVIMGHCVGQSPQTSSWFGLKNSPHHLEFGRKCNLCEMVFPLNLIKPEKSPTLPPTQVLFVCLFVFFAVRVRKNMG